MNSIKNSLSVCIIAKNEENMIRDCLESVKSISNDIIIVDTGSTDNTKSIALEYTNRVLNYEWNDDFAAARNFCLHHAKNDFILSIDCDERLVNPNSVELKLNQLDQNIGGIMVKVVSYNDKKEGKDVFNSKMIRLFRNNPNIRFEGIIHEQVIDSIINAGFKISDSNIEFIHEGYNHDAVTMRKKQKRNLDLLLRQTKLDPNNAYNLFQLARTYLALNDLHNAETIIADAISLSTNDDSVKPQALNYGALIAYKNNNKDLAKARAELSLSLQPNQGFANYIIGECHYDNHLHNKAIESYNAMLEAYANEDLKSNIIGDYKLPTSQIYFRLGRSYLAIGNIKVSKLNFKEGLKHNEKDINCLVGIADILNKESDYENALIYLRKAKQAAPQRKEIDGYINVVLNSIKDLKVNKTKENNTEPLITLSMIVKNEEKMIRGCLESAERLVDEIVIVDTGSTDRTVEIAKEFGAKVYFFDWINDFAAARNESLKYSKGKWVLYLDADERISQFEVDKFRKSLRELPDNTGGLICTIESPHANLTGDKSDVHRGSYPRIFRNLGVNKVKFQGRVHEQISPSLKENNLVLMQSDIIIYHLGYDQSRKIMESKIERNYRMLLQHVREEPTNGYAWYQLGQTLGHMNLKKEAEETIKFALKCGNLSPMIEASACASLAQFTGNDKRFNEALSWSSRSLELIPNSLYAMNLHAYSLLHLGRFEEAEIEFKKTLELKSKFYNTAPTSGYDVDIPKSIIEDGLNKASNKIYPKL
jgi:glycosyltransferase involved in cell wall biosynthesis